MPQKGSCISCRYIKNRNLWLKTSEPQSHVLELENGTNHKMKVAFQPELCTSLVGNSQHASSHHHEASCRANLATTWSHHTTLLCVARIRSWNLNPSPEFSYNFLGQPRDFQSKFSFEVTFSSIHICTICISIFSIYFMLPYTCTVMHMRSFNKRTLPWSSSRSRASAKTSANITSFPRKWTLLSSDSIKSNQCCRRLFETLIYFLLYGGIWRMSYIISLGHPGSMSVDISGFAQVVAR